MARSVLRTVLRRGETPAGTEGRGVARHCSSAVAAASGAEERVRARGGERKRRRRGNGLRFSSAVDSGEVNAGGMIPWTLVDKQAAGKPGAKAAVCDRGWWRVAEGGAAVWPRMASAVMRQPARSVKRLVRVTGGLSPISDFSQDFQTTKF
jgi:hypothetical protein